MTKIEKDSVCPVEVCLSFISDKWVVLILRDLLTGTKRFSGLKKSLNPITQKMLTQQLRKMEENGIIHREVYPVIPPKVEYSLTELGKSLEPIIMTMREWGLDYQDKRK